MALPASDTITSRRWFLLPSLCLLINSALVQLQHAINRCMKRTLPLLCLCFRALTCLLSLTLAGCNILCQKWQNLTVLGFLESEIRKNNQKELFTQPPFLKRIASLLQLPNLGCQVVEHKSRKSSLVCAMAAYKCWINFCCKHTEQFWFSYQGLVQHQGSCWVPCSSQGQKEQVSTLFPNLALFPRGATTFS